MFRLRQGAGPPDILAQGAGPPDILTQGAGPPDILTQGAGPPDILTQGAVLYRSGIKFHLSLCSSLLSKQTANVRQSEERVCVLHTVQVGFRSTFLSSLK